MTRQNLGQLVDFLSEYPDGQMVMLRGRITARSLGPEPTYTVEVPGNRGPRLVQSVRHVAAVTRAQERAEGTI